MRDAPGDILELVEHPDFDRAVPTPDHFIPLAVHRRRSPRPRATRPTVLIDGYAYGSLSMTCYTLGSDGASGTSQAPATTIPPPEDVPIDQSNL